MGGTVLLWFESAEGDDDALSALSLHVSSPQDAVLAAIRDGGWTVTVEKTNDADAWVFVDPPGDRLRAWELGSLGRKFRLPDLPDLTSLDVRPAHWIKLDGHALERVGRLPDGWKEELQQFLREHDPEREPPAETVSPSRRAPATAMATHIFLSYARADQEYVDRLVKHLHGKGVTVWIDKAIEYGTRWHEVIEEKIDTCAAMVVVMTAQANASTWVAREIQEAEDEGKAILPLLLDGKRFFRFGHIQYEDVTDGTMPSGAFVERLRRLMTA